MRRRRRPRSGRRRRRHRHRAVDIPQIKTLALDKSSIDGPYDTVGEVLHYTYTLTNTGNVTLGGPFDITDDKATDAACTDSTVAPGDSITCTGTYAVTQADLDAGSVTNTATGTGEVRRRDDHLEPGLGDDPGRPEARRSASSSRPPSRATTRRARRSTTRTS